MAEANNNLPPGQMTAEMLRAFATLLREAVRIARRDGNSGVDTVRLLEFALRDMVEDEREPVEMPYGLLKELRDMRASNPTQSQVCDILLVRAEVIEAAARGELK